MKRNSQSYIDLERGRNILPLKENLYRNKVKELIRSDTRSDSTTLEVKEVFDFERIYECQLPTRIKMLMKNKNEHQIENMKMPLAGQFNRKYNLKQCSYNFKHIKVDRITRSKD